MSGESRLTEPRMFYKSTDGATAQGSQSIVIEVLSKHTAAKNLSQSQHKLALEYLAINLAIRDRNEIVRVLCHHQPDLLTSAVEDLVTVYDPIIRALHNAVDLSAGTGDLQSFLHDLVEISRSSGKSNDKQPASVEDYVRLLKKHQGSSHRFIHQAIKNGKELAEWYRGYAKHAAAQYQQKASQPPTSTDDGIAAAGDMTNDLNSLIADLSDDDRTKVYRELDEHAKYLQHLSSESSQRMKAAVKSSNEGKSAMSYGPGTFLAKWQSLINITPITPATADGSVRHGMDDSVQQETRVDVDGSKKGSITPTERNTDPPPPDVSNTVQLLLPGFRRLLVKLSTEA